MKFTLNLSQLLFDISRKRHKTSFRRITNPIMARKKENRHDVLVHCHQGVIEYPNEDSRLGGLRANRYTALHMVNCLMIFLVPEHTYLYHLMLIVDVALLYDWLYILFLLNHNIPKSSCSLCFWASDPLIERF